jgi:transposase-like protein
MIGMPATPGNENIAQRRTRGFNEIRLFSEEPHRAIKRRVNASQGFRSFHGARRTIQGYEVVHMIRKGQVRWLPKGDVLGLILFLNELLGLGAE